MAHSTHLQEVPINEKVLLTLEECTAYTGIGFLKLRKLTNEPNCPFVIWVGSKKMVNRKKLDEYIDSACSI